MNIEVYFEKTLSMEQAKQYPWRNQHFWAGSLEEKRDEWIFHKNC